MGDTVQMTEKIEKLITKLDLYLQGKLVTHVTLQYWNELKEELKNANER